MRAWKYANKRKSETLKGPLDRELFGRSKKDCKLTVISELELRFPTYIVNGKWELWNEDGNLKEESKKMHNEQELHRRHAEEREAMHKEHHAEREKLHELHTSQLRKLEMRQDNERRGGKRSDEQILGL